MWPCNGAQGKVVRCNTNTHRYAVALESRAVSAKDENLDLHMRMWWSKFSSLTETASLSKATVYLRVSVLYRTTFPCAPLHGHIELNHKEISRKMARVVLSPFPIDFLLLFIRKSKENSLGGSWPITC